jgi:hypothetical protein
LERSNLKDRPIQSLWIGKKLSLLEQLCIKSFLGNGHKFHLYTYESVENVPSGTTVIDANTVMRLNEKYEINHGFGTGSKAPFSDIFRLTLLNQKGGWWVDMDVICLKNLNSLPQKVLCTSLEIPEGDFANINVMTFPANEPFLTACLKEWHEFDLQNIYYALGVDLIKKIASDKAFDFQVGHSIFNPVSYRHSKFIFIPKFLIPLINIYKKLRNQELIELPGKDSYTLHLWNESLKNSNINKNESYSYFSLIEQLKRKYL